MFDVKQGIALHAMQGNRASSHGVGEVSWFFSSCCGSLGYILKVYRGWPFKTRVCSVTSRPLSNCKRHLGIPLEAWQGNRDSSRCKARDQVSLCSCQRDIGIPINFQVSQASSTFEALNSSCLSSCQRHVRGPVEMRWRTRSFSSVSTLDSDVPSS